MEQSRIDDIGDDPLVNCLIEHAETMALSEADPTVEQLRKEFEEVTNILQTSILPETGAPLSEEERFVFRELAQGLQRQIEVASASEEVAREVTEFVADLTVQQQSGKVMVISSEAIDNPQRKEITRRFALSCG